MNLKLNKLSYLSKNRKIFIAAILCNFIQKD